MDYVFRLFGLLALANRIYFDYNVIMIMWNNRTQRFCNTGELVPEPAPSPEEGLLNGCGSFIRSDGLKAGSDCGNNGCEKYER